MYFELAADAVISYAAYRFFGWIGFAVWVFFVISRYCLQLVKDQRIMRDTLLSRLPDRCAMCKREIVDEGGILADENIYHEACSDKLGPR